MALPGVQVEGETHISASRGIRPSSVEVAMIPLSTNWLARPFNGTPCFESEINVSSNANTAPDQKATVSEVSTRTEVTHPGRFGRIIMS